MAATFETLMRLDADLVAGGSFPLSDFWREQGHRLYSHPTAGTFVAQVGRGGAKSFFSRRIALNEAIHGEWDPPLGERHYWLFVSENTPEAGQRLLGLEADLKVLQIPYHRDGDEIALMDAAIGFMVRAAQIGRVSGFRSFGWSVDEHAKLRDDQTLANPARELIASANALLVTHLGSSTDRPKRLMLSSPFSVVDDHYERFSRGDTDDQIVVNAPTWVANPSVTEEETHRLEPDLAVWAREYAARPSAAAGLAFGDPEDVEACFGPLPEGYAA